MTPQLNVPLRSLEQAKADIAALRRREASAAQSRIERGEGLDIDERYLSMPSTISALEGVE